MNLLLLTAITAVNFAIVLSVALAPISFSWISFNGLSAMAVVQAIVIFLVYSSQKQYEEY